VQPDCESKNPTTITSGQHWTSVTWVLLTSPSKSSTVS